MRETMYRRRKTGKRRNREIGREVRKIGNV
jgi:hypothetical protein